MKIKLVKKLIIYMIVVDIIILVAFLIYQKNIVKNYSRKQTYNITKGLNDKYGQVPILMYHSISTNEKRNPLMLGKDKFEEQMRYLKKNRYNTINLEELYNHYIKGKKLPQKPIVITFDDGYVDNYKNAYFILKKYNQKATIFIITKYVNKGNAYLNTAQLKEMHKNGVDIESHTFNHNRLDRLSYNEQIEELQESKKFLEKTLNKKVRYIAYPFGQCNIETIKAASKLGYKMGLCAFNFGRWSNYDDGIYTMDRIYISSNHTMETFKKRITDPNYSFIYLRDISINVKIEVSVGIVFIVFLILIIKKRAQAVTKSQEEIR